MRWKRITKDINLINLIGYAFDTPEQPDYKYFMRHGVLHIDELVMRYKDIWHYAFRCAKDIGVQNLKVFKVGGGAFSPVNDYDKLIFEPSISPVIAMYPEINVLFSNDFRIPHSLSPLSQKTLDNTLYINAWDPWSFVGNGNAMDRSLDGFWGRCTAASVLAWPISNPNISYLDIHSFTT